MFRCAFVVLVVVCASCYDCYSFKIFTAVRLEKKSHGQVRIFDVTMRNFAFSSHLKIHHLQMIHSKIQLNALLITCTHIYVKNTNRQLTAPIVSLQQCKFHSNSRNC